MAADNKRTGRSHAHQSEIQVLPTDAAGVLFMDRADAARRARMIALQLEFMNEGRERHAALAPADLARMEEEVADLARRVHELLEAIERGTRRGRSASDDWRLARAVVDAEGVMSSF